MSAEERVRELERANEELRRANAALARERQGASHTAAATALLKLHEAQGQLASMESSLSWRITAPLRWAKRLIRRLVGALTPGRGRQPR